MFLLENTLTSFSQLVSQARVDLSLPYFPPADVQNYEFSSYLDFYLI